VLAFPTSGATGDSGRATLGALIESGLMLIEHPADGLFFRSLSSQVVRMEVGKSSATRR